MTDLITRLSKLDAPDREVDGEIMQAIDPILWSKAYLLAQEPCGCSKEMATEEAKLRAPLYTASVDAAIALAERVLPGCDIETSDVHADFRGAKEPRHIADLSSDLVWEKYDGYPEPVYRIRGTGQSNIRAVALCIALLRAKEASKP